MRHPLLPLFAFAAFAVVLALAASRHEPTPRVARRPPAEVTMPPLAPGEGWLMGDDLGMIDLFASAQAAEQIQRLNAQGDALLIDTLDLGRYRTLLRAPLRVKRLTKRGSWAKVAIAWGDGKGKIGWVATSCIRVE